MEWPSHSHVSEVPEKKSSPEQSFPLEMYTVSGFLPPSSSHYEKSRRFDTTIITEASQDVIPERKSVFPGTKSAPHILQELTLINSDKMLHFSPTERLATIQKIFSLSEEAQVLVVTEADSLFKLNEQATVIRSALDSQFLSVQRVATQKLDCLPEQERLELLKDPVLARLIVSSPLYRYKDINDVSFARRDFAKSGSETTLLGGSLYEHLIIRHLKPKTFLAWQKAYENWQGWELAEFDYVPVEPIQSYRLSQSGYVDVASGVLDISLDKWSKLYPEIFTQELRNIAQQIKTTLETMGVNHGHPHLGNFALRFFRIPNGDIDFSRLPRLYIIDFDEAKS